MPLFESFRARRLADRAVQAFASDGWTAAEAVLSGAGAGLGAAAWAHFAVELYNEDHNSEAERAILRALELEPDRGDALIFLAELQAETGRADDAIASYRRLLRRFPEAAVQALELAKLLCARGAFDDARTVLLPFASYPSFALRLLLAKAHYELGEHGATVDLLAPTVKQMRIELQGSFYGKARESLIADYQEANLLHDDAYAALHGREKVIESAVAAGALNARAGINYRLLGEARMVRPRSWSADARLRSVEDGLAFGEALVAGGERSRGLCHVALARLRQGQLDQAQALFDRARTEDDDNFAAYLGLGAAMDLEHARTFDRLDRLLPEIAAVDALPPGLEAVVTDWPALTALERRVALAAAQPLAGLLPSIAAAGARALVLPIDAMLTDLPEMQEGADERHDDHRCLRAITGAANARVCASKIEELLDFAGERDLVFAHELAHLAHFHAPDDVQEQIESLYGRAIEEEHVVTAYQTTNSAEFFAVAYTDYLAHRYDLPSRRELDDAGLVGETFALIDQLGERR